jgi:N-acetylglucosamine-6-phosphate deacetylase
MLALSGADLVLPDRLLSPGTLVIDAGRIVDIRGASGGALHQHYIVPGFVDVHVHGAAGVDTLDGTGSIAAIARHLPRHGVTAFCPTSVASRPTALRAMLAELCELRRSPLPRAARVLPAHLESNFINPQYRGAQELSCLRSPRAALAATELAGAGLEFSGADILAEIERAALEVGIVTMAPELDGGLDLIGWLRGRGHRVSLGHSAATYEQAQAAIAAGASQATHLFNRMAPFGHRAPGLVGAVLEADHVAAELICDGFHVHPAVVRTTVTAKGAARIFAVTDGTAASGLPIGSRAALGGQPITVGGAAAFLDDGTLAGSTTTMDRVFRMLVMQVGLSLVDAATMCATTAARELGLGDCGMLAVGATADLVVLDSALTVVQTYVRGELIYSRR